METYNAKLISADLEESTMEFEIQHEFTVKAGDYVILHKVDYEQLVSGADLKKGKFPIPHIIKSLPVSKEGLKEYMETTLEGRMLLLNITFPIANYFKTHPEKLKELAIEIVGNLL